MYKNRIEIKEDITRAFVENPYIIQAYGLVPGKSFDQQFSKLSLENVLFDIISYAIWILQELFATHKKEVESLIDNQKSGTPAWYRYKTLQYQKGFDLLPGSDKFDNAGATAEQIAQSKIIKYAAVTESDEPGTIVIKIAGEDSGELQPIPDNEMPAIETYLNEIKWAGTRVRVINYLPDLLRLNLVIYRDPLVLDENGVHIRTGKKPVEEAINNYLKNLPFDGELVLAHLIDAIQQADGVLIPHLTEASSKWIDPNTGGYGNWQNIDVKKIPESGYFKIETFDTISYVV